MTGITRNPLTRVRHDLVYRHLTVRHVQRVTPRMLRITLAGAELDGFYSPAFDDHVKVFFPEKGQVYPTMPIAGPDGPMPPSSGIVSPCRSYTPRRIDLAGQELDIDVMLHGVGVADTWVRQAMPGDFVGIGGPRRSFLVPDDVEWQLMLGDETAIPAVSRRLAELPEHVKAVVALEVADATEQQQLPSPADATVVWLSRENIAPGRSGLKQFVREIAIPEGPHYIWGAGESRQMREIRSYLNTERGVDPGRTRVTGYWTAGIPNHVE